MEADVLAGLVKERLTELVLAPLRNQEMLWAAVPLLAATLFITLYFGRHRKEELGWNTAFGNTMVFLFVAINLIREMYSSGGAGSWDNVLSNSLYLALALALACASLLLMFITYFHLLPKKVAFFLFSAPPINTTVYVAMAMVYANVPPDYLTALAGLLFLACILVAEKMLQFFIRLIGLGDDGAEAPEPKAGEPATRAEEEI